MTNIWDLQYGFRRKSLYRSAMNMPDLDIIKQFILNSHAYEMCSCHTFQNARTNDNVCCSEPFLKKTTNWFSRPIIA